MDVLSLCLVSISPELHHRDCLFVLQGGEVFVSGYEQICVEPQEQQVQSMTSELLEGVAKRAKLFVCWDHFSNISKLKCCSDFPASAFPDQILFNLPGLVRLASAQMTQASLCRVCCLQRQTTPYVVQVVWICLDLFGTLARLVDFSEGGTEPSPSH